jgi:hypothetical protein
LLSLVVGRREGAVARVRVSLEAFQRGALPPVCAKTGGPADCLLPVRAAYTPGWTWLLLVFGGLWAFLISRGFTTEDGNRILGKSPNASGAASAAAATIATPPNKT